MSEAIKAIETFYNGYRFRSRLEARWAVFFDECGILYEYEPQGFKLSDGTCYLPDFYLPWFKAYVEIKRKGMPKNDVETAKRKLEHLFYDLEEEECICLFCEGDPLECEMQVYCNEVDDGGGSTGWWSARFIEGGWYDDENGGYSGGKHYITIAVGEPDDRRERSYYAWGDSCCMEQYARLFNYRYDFTDAKEKARQARFEHGERG